MRTRFCLTTHSCGFLDSFLILDALCVFSATVQACFKLQKPVSLLIPHIRRLEYDISGEIGVPYTKVFFQAENCIFFYLVLFLNKEKINLKANVLNRWLLYQCTRQVLLTGLMWCLVFFRIQ